MASTSYQYPTRLFYPVTPVAETYPEPRRPLKDSRQKVAQVLRSFVVPDSVTRTPRADIRETANKYYIDVDLAGLASVKDLKIQWTSPKAILVCGEIKRALTAEEQNKDGSVHYLKAERSVGTIMRAFEFAVDVDHESLKVELNNGLLNMIVDKKPREN